MVECRHPNRKKVKKMATAIRSIPTLHGDVARNFDSEAQRTEKNPGSQDYRREATVVAKFLKKTNVL
jgi:hypothetical protein